MRILFILPQIPWPPESGGRIVTSNTVRRFARSNDVWVVCLYHHPGELAHLGTVKEWCREVAAFPAHKKWDPRTLLLSCFSRSPYKALRFLNRDMCGYVSRLVQREHIEVIHAQNFYTTAYVRGDEPCLRVHYKENIEGYLLDRYAETLRNRLLIRAVRREAVKTLHYELAGARKFHRLLSISNVDARLINGLEPGLYAIYQRAGVDLNRYGVLPEPDGPPTVLFTGTMSYHPNYNGMLRFLSDGWHLVRTKIQDARFLVVGHNPPARLKEWDGREGVTITGSVPDVHTYFDRAHVYLVPLWVGGGIRLKILEAMAVGRPVVSTSIGCEGLEIEEGTHLQIANDPKGLAEKTAQLLKDADLRNRLARQARTRIEERYDWDDVIAEQESRYRRWLREMR